MRTLTCPECGSDFQTNASRTVRCGKVECEKSDKRKRYQAAKLAGYSYYAQKIKNDPIRLQDFYEKSKVNQRGLRSWLADYKLERGCMDCGYRKHSAALDMDHTGPKTAEISAIKTSTKRMLAEISAGSVVVRCANCHGIKTWAERNGHSNPTGHCHDGDGCSR